VTAIRTHAIAVIPGDGIGREVTPAALEVLEAVGRAHGFALRLTEHPWGCDHFVQTGRMMPAGALEALGESDAILLGAVGRPDVADHVSLWGLLIPIRRAFRQYVNLRPVRLWPGIRSPLRDVTPADVDMVIVRENNEGEYSEIGGRLHQGTEDELAVQEAVFTRRGTIASSSTPARWRRRAPGASARPRSPTGSSTRCPSGTSASPTSPRRIRSSRASRC
jgi:tartrate dehydrogenase/decarboxylase / D-malate dehydrogenase